MLRYLLIFTLIFYALYKLGFFRSLSSGYTEKDKRKVRNSNLNVDNVPPKEKKKADFKGGDYVDYEEIK
jgi:hypothetical protein